LSGVPFSLHFHGQVFKLARKIFAFVSNSNFKPDFFCLIFHRARTGNNAMVVLVHEVISQCQCGGNCWFCKAGSHPLFHPKLWKATLKCFTEMEAMTVDYTYGGFAVPWLIRERITGNPGPYSWIQAATNQSVGMMIYLEKYKTPCSNIEDILQYAVDNNHLSTVVFLLNRRNVFVDGNRRTIDFRGIPRLDQAVTQNFTTMVRLLLAVTTSSHYSKLLENPIATVTTVLSLGFCEMLKLIVPSLAHVSNSRGLVLAAKNGHTRTFQYAVEHLNEQHIPTIPDSVIEAACEHGHMAILRACMRDEVPSVPLSAFNVAFINGQKDVVKFIKSIHPRYTPSDHVFVEACKQGRNAMVAAVRNVRIPPKCLEVACKGTSSKLVRTLHRRLPEVSFKPSMLTDAIRAATPKLYGVVNAVYEYGQFTDLTKKQKLMLASRRLHMCLRIFHSIGLEVYTKEVLVEACRVCCPEIVEDMLSSDWGGVVPDEKTVSECQHRLFLADAYNKDDKVRVFTLLSQFSSTAAPRKQTTEPPLAPQDLTDMDPACPLRNIDDGISLRPSKRVKF
jgi:hypothetical protein